MPVVDYARFARHIHDMLGTGSHPTIKSKWFYLKASSASAMLMVTDRTFDIQTQYIPHIILLGTRHRIIFWPHCITFCPPGPLRPVGLSRSPSYGVLNGVWACGPHVFFGSCTILSRLRLDRPLSLLCYGYCLNSLRIHASFTGEKVPSASSWCFGLS